MEKSESFCGLYRLVTARYVLGVLYRENRPKSENWVNLTPCSSATVRRRGKLTDLGNSLALGLQHGVNSISLQCIPWPVACSEWGACSTDFRFQILGANDPQSENFRKCLSGWRDGTPKYVSWPNLVEIDRCEIVENSRSAGVVPAPILPKMCLSRPNFPERCHPLTCPLVPNLVRIGCVLPDLFRKDWFFGPKSNYNIRGFQPTISMTLYSRCCHLPSDGVT